MRKHICVSIDEDLFNAVRDYADALGFTFSGFIHSLLIQNVPEPFLEAYNNKPCDILPFDFCNDED